MKRMVHWLAPLFALIGLGGCTAVSGFPERSVDFDNEIAAYESYLGPQAVTAYSAADDSARGGLSKRAWRNEVLEARIRVDNLHFSEFEQALHEEGVGFGIGTDWIVLALTGAGAVATGGATNALSAAAAGVTGARASVEKEALYQKTIPALMAQMVAKRKEVLVRIRQGEQLDEASYSLFQGLADLENYYFAGTIPGAIIEVAESAGAQSRQAELDLKSIQVVGPVAQDLQARRETAAAFVKDPARQLSDLTALARALGKLPGPAAARDDVLSDILLSIAAAQTHAQFEKIAQAIKILFGKDV